LVVTAVAAGEIAAEGTAAETDADLTTDLNPKDLNSARDAVAAAVAET